MEMQQVRYFITLAKTLNFTRAAEECNVSQPSLTRAIRLLEEEFGGELLRRERHAVASDRARPAHAAADAAMLRERSRRQDARDR